MQAGDSHMFIAGDATVDLPCCTRRRTKAGSPARTPGAIRKSSSAARRAPLGIVFTDPQIAVAGQSYRDFADRGDEIAIGEVSFEDQGRARVKLANKGPASGLW